MQQQHQQQQTIQQQSINNNPKYHQPPTYNNGNSHTNGNGVAAAPPPQLVRNNVVMNASIPAGGVSASSQIQQQLQQKYYDQYENYARPANGNANGNGVNNNHQNGMSQSAYNGTKAYAAHPQMTASYNQQQMSYPQHYNSHPQNGANVGKIADYDPLTDGPRNAPQTARTNQTLIYSSDRAAREYSDSKLYLSSSFFVLFLFVLRTLEHILLCFYVNCARKNFYKSFIRIKKLNLKIQNLICIKNNSSVDAKSTTTTAAKNWKCERY
jgi:hypothetical protein